VRPSAVYVYVIHSEHAGFRDTKSAAAREPDNDHSDVSLRRLFCEYRRTDNRENLLARMAEELRLPSEQLAVTNALRAFTGSGDSMEVVELTLAVEEKLSAESGTS
jgi:hypothetical protein